MTLGYMIGTETGAAEGLLAAVADRLLAEGWRMAGALQVTTPVPGGRSDMDLRILGQEGVRVRISQCLGALSQGCRLDPGGLEAAVGRVEAGMDRARPQLLIVNKFGKVELAGRGFRPLIGRALAEGVPVLLSVAPDGLEGFLAFTEGAGSRVPAEVGAALDWCRAAMAGIEA